MVIKELLEYGIENLKNNLYTVPLNESRRILSFLLDRDVSTIAISENENVDDEIVEKFKKIIDRRKLGEPLQYIINEANFYGYDFYVDEGCLIPRFDTENLVQKVIEIGNTFERPDILEIGAGSGAIASTIAMELPKSRVTGVDISDAALRVCNINKDKYKIENLQFIKSDLFSEVKSCFDIIVSNPPYIKQNDMETLQKEVQYEPKLALDGGVDGLDFYRVISKKSVEHLKIGGYLVFEIGYDQGLEAKELLLSHGFNKIDIIKDIQGHDRVVVAVMED